MLLSSAHANDPADVLPQDSRSESVQSPAEFFGFAIGSRHLRHDQIVSYFRRLAEDSPRVELISYGETHGRRPLVAAVITSPDNLERLDEIRRDRRRLTSGKLSEPPEDALTVMYMGYNVHGDEASAANAAPLVAYHLASSESDEMKRRLERSVFLVDPALNPDGLDRFANWVNENRGRYANESNADREHNQPWPGGRTNYYWFDLNRDWLPAVHPESRGRLRLFHQWKPNVALDYHEMSGNSSYFFQPGVPARNNPLSPEENLRLTRAFAEEHAAAMDEAAELFFTEERFDDFYVGKGSTYPDLHGCVGILFEQGSTRALRLTNERTRRHFRDTVANQVRTSLSSLRAADRNRDKLLKYQVDFYRAALQEGRDAEITAYLLTGPADRINAAADMLRRHAIRAFQPQRPVKVDGQHRLPHEILIVPTAQEEYTFVRSLMETPQSFRENLFYDVSAWHLPSAFGLQCETYTSELPSQWSAGRSPDDDSAGFSRDEAAAGYAVKPQDLEAPALIAGLLRREIDVRVTPEPLKLGRSGGTLELPAGTFLVLRQPNRRRWNGVLDTLEKAAEGGNVVAVPLASSRIDSGPDLGSDSIRQLKACNPLLVVGPGTSQGSAGALWHFLDVRMKMPHTLGDTGRLGSLSLDDYSCVILPAGSYSGLGSGDFEALGDYVRSGGTVVAVASAINVLARRKLISLDGEPEEEDDASDAAAKGDDALTYAGAADRRALESVAGAFLMTEIDQTHPLAYGFTSTEVPVFRDHAARFPIPKNPYQTVARYSDVIAGYVSDRNRKRLIGSAAVHVQPSGRGRYILLADDPVFRGYVRSSERFLTNAILLGPGLSIPSSP